MQRLNLWYKQHQDYLSEKTLNPRTRRYWYPHKRLRRSYFNIKRVLPNMFHYLENPKIPNTTNGIEGFFSHLKNHLDLHRGLTIKHRMDFIKWYIYFSANPPQRDPFGADKGVLSQRSKGLLPKGMPLALEDALWYGPLDRYYCSASWSPPVLTSSSYRRAEPKQLSHKSHQLFSVHCPKYKFQFLNGTIESAAEQISTVFKFSFQFLNGTIERPPCKFPKFSNFHFNS